MNEAMKKEITADSIKFRSILAPNHGFENRKLSQQSLKKRDPNARSNRNYK